MTDRKKLIDLHPGKRSTLRKQREYRIKGASAGYIGRITRSLELIADPIQLQNAIVGQICEVFDTTRVALFLRDPDEGTRPPSKAGTWAGDPFAEYVPARAKLSNKMTDARNQIFDAYINQMLAQIYTGRNVIRISPTVLYQYTSETIIGTGIVRFKNLYNQIKRYKEHLKAYIVDKDKGDSASAHLLFQSHGSTCISQKPVDFNTVPQFEETPPSLAESLKSTVWDIAALVILNILLFTGAYLSFLRYEI